MSIKQTCVMLLMLAALPVVAQQQEQVPTLDEQREVLGRFEPYSGHWLATITSNPTLHNPEAGQFTMQWDGGAIFDGTAYLYRGLIHYDAQSVEYLLFYAYDERRGAYIEWLHDEFSNHTLVMDWAEDGRSYALRPVPGEEPQGVTVDADFFMVDDQTMRSTLLVVDEAGDKVVDQTWVAHPEPGELVFPEVEIAPPDEPGAEADPLSMMRPHTGQWNSTVTGRATGLVAEPYTYQGHWFTSERVGGRVMLHEGTIESETDTYQYIWVYTYDSNEQAYVAWYHDSLGHHGKFDAEWDEERREMTLRLVDAEDYGYDITFVDRYIDDDTLEFSFRMILEDGNVVMDETGRATRVSDEVPDAEEIDEAAE